MAKKVNETLPLEAEPSLIDNIVMRPKLEADPLVVTATATNAISEGLKNIKEVPRISFVRKNREQQQNLQEYFFGLLPITKRKTIHVCGNVTLAMLTGTAKELSSGDFASVRDIGAVGRLDDEQIAEVMKKILKKGIKFNFWGDYAKPFNIQEDHPSDHQWEPNTYPLGQFVYFESVLDLNKKFGNESGWRHKSVPMRSLIPRVPIPDGYKGKITEDMGDGWTNHWPIKPKRDVAGSEHEIEVKLI